jgi:hypothetical protein
MFAHGQNAVGESQVRIPFICKMEISSQQKAHIQAVKIRGWSRGGIGFFLAAYQGGKRQSCLGRKAWIKIEPVQQGDFDVVQVQEIFCKIVLIRIGIFAASFLDKIDFHLDGSIVVEVDVHKASEEDPGLVITCKIIATDLRSTDAPFDPCIKFLGLQ